MSVNRISLGIRYDGTDYHGWQSQDNLSTVQQRLELALARVADHPISLTCAVRTDAGVHVWVDTNDETTDLGSSNLVGDFSNAADFEIGRDGNSGSFQDDVIDEVAFWTRPITSAEVTEIYNSGAALPFASWDVTVGGFMTPNTGYWGI